MLKMIVNFMQLGIFLLISFHATWGYSQCQASLSHDSGPSNYREGQLPSNIVKQEKDWRYSLYENLKKDNLSGKDKVFGLITVLLMFFGLFANRKKIFQISLVVYAVPMIVYYLSFEKSYPTTLGFIIILTIMMFMWGASFNFRVKYSKTLFFHLAIWMLIGALLLIPVLYTKMFNIWHHLQNLNLNIVANLHEQLIYFLMILLLGGALTTIVHYGLHQVIKPSTQDLDPDKTFPVLGLKIVLFTFWMGAFLFAKPLGVYLLTIFLLGNIFREKEIVGDMYLGIRKYRLFFIFNYVLAILFGGNYLLHGQLAYDKILVITGSIALICFLYVAAVLILKKMFTKSIDPLQLMSVNPFFMLSFILLSGGLINISLKNFFYMSSITTVMAIAFMV